MTKQLLHLHTFGVLIGTNKTRKTLCDRRVPESAMAQNKQEADCPICRAKRDEEIDGTLVMLAYAETQDVMNNELHKLKETLSKEPRYTNAEFLR